MTATMDTYLISLIQQCSYDPELKSEILQKIPELSLEQKAELKLAALERLIIDAQEELLSKKSQEDIETMTIEDMRLLNEQVENVLLAKEDLSVSEADMAQIKASLADLQKQPTS